MGLNPFAKESYVGVDIGTHTLKAVQLEPCPGGWRILAAGSFPSPTESVRDGVVVDTEGVGHAIRDLVRAHDITASTANIAVAGSSVIVRTVKLPKMNEASLRKSIKFEAGKYVPSSIEDSYIEFEIIGDCEDNKMDVLVVAAPKEMVESRVTACRLAGLDTELVDIEGFALYRALIEYQADNNYKDEVIALVDMGGWHTHISMIAYGQFSLTRSIPIAGATFTDAISTYFRTNPGEAEETKRRLDFAQLCEENANIQDSAELRLLQPIVDELVREIRRSINYYQTQHTEGGSGAPVSTVIATGGCSRVPGIGQYIGYKLGIPCVALGVWDTGRFQFASDDMDVGGEDYGVAAGLAMRRPGRQAVAA